MNITEEEIKEIRLKYSRQITRLDKMILNLHSVANIRYWYFCLSKYGHLEINHENLMQMDAFTTSIVISYGRLFGRGTGTTVINNDDIPVQFKSVHDEIIDLRHARYAHHGAHRSIEKRIGIQSIEGSLEVSTNIELDFCYGAPKEWAPLFEWLDGHMYNSVHEIIDLLSKETGIRWTIRNGPVPKWV